jgi:hypothetical protein
MSSIYSIADIQAYLFTGTPAYEITTLPGHYVRISEFIFSVWPLITAQVTTLGIGIPTIGGSGDVDIRQMLAEDLGPSNFIAIVTDWNNPPTQPTVFYRRFNLLAGANTAGRVRLTFPRGLAIAGNSSIVVWCITSAVRGNFIEMSVALES